MHFGVLGVVEKEAATNSYHQQLATFSCKIFHIAEVMLSNFSSADR
jgi:hypothetical protein